MSNTNFTILIGRLGQTPEIRTTDNATIANLSLATNRKFKQGQEYVEKTDWHRVVCFGHQANYISQFADKGTLVSVEGRLQTRDYTGDDGVKRFITEVVASRVNILSGGVSKEKAPTPDIQSPDYGKFKDGLVNDDIPF